MLNRTRKFVTGVVLGALAVWAVLRTAPRVSHDRLRRNDVPDRRPR